MMFFMFMMLLVLVMLFVFVLVLVTMLVVPVVGVVKLGWRSVHGQGAARALPDACLASEAFLGGCQSNMLIAI